MFFMPRNKEESKEQHRIQYERDKNELTRLFHEQGYDKKNLNTFFVNSLKDHYEEELKEDGLL